MFQTSPLIIIMPCFRIPARRYEFFLVMFFATDEINKNPYLLPNMSLIFPINHGQCEKTLGDLDKIYSEKNYTVEFTDYICVSFGTCFIALIGPSWKTSIKLSINSGTPRVRICDTG
jgi:vomeronasal 2 receptor